MRMLRIHALKRSPAPLAALIAIGSAGVLMLPPSAAGQTAERTQNYDAFRLVRTRNIFDPDRRAARSDNAPRPQTTTATGRPNYVAVTGTMVAAGKSLAFFTGSRPEYSKVISLRDTIADFTITGITPKEVELERAGKQIVVPVGRQLPLEGAAAASSDPGPWPPAPDAHGANAASPPEAAPSTSSSPPDKNELLRRMMERRAKEISK
ncbi:MAG: hypothetical protein M3463_22835 [Verrucomicrobiota bacterium]|nr:hypothetical protein [Verrucomicrobiota bacterium]